MTTLRASAGLLILVASLHGQVSQDWTHYVRIAGNGLAWIEVG